MTGNLNLVDLDPGPDDTSMAGHGGSETMWAASLFGTLAGTRLPGLGTATKEVNVKFIQEVPHGTPVTATVTVQSKDVANGTLVLDCQAVNAAGEPVVIGTAEVVAPKRKLRHEARNLGKVQLNRGERYMELVNRCEGMPALTCAVVHPCSADALEGAVLAAEANLITPILVGPKKKIRAVAEEGGYNIEPYRIVSTEHSHHSAEVSVGLVRDGEAYTLMKGSLHTDELLSRVFSRASGMRTERRISHCFLIAVPTYSRPIIVTDAAINVNPDLTDKAHIVQNAIELAHAVGIAEPKVAILAAVESVNPHMPSTLDAAALCKMADRGQIKGGLLDGPLAFDNAVDVDAAITKGIVSPVAGRADILLVPDLEAGNMLAKQLTYMANAEAAGIVLGAKAPIVLTSRADNAQTRLASCAVAVLFADAQQKGAALLKAAAE
jgi:phosphate acetyltransferase